MNHPPTTEDRSLSILLDLIHRRTGLIYENGRRDLIANKLSPLISERGMDSYLDYYYFLKYDPQADGEWRQVERALAVNETYFWREFDQIKAVVDVLLPQLQDERPGLPVRIWHAACATGEEPYTMAIALLETNCYLKGPIEIIGTDFNSEALALARAAIYRPRSFRSIPSEIMERYFTPIDNEKYHLSDKIRERVQFYHLNLMDQANMRRMKDFDVIFCRNAFIYFSKKAIQTVTESFYNSLQEAGYLFVAAAESLLKATTLFDLVDVGGTFVYKKGGR